MNKSRHFSFGILVLVLALMPFTAFADRFTYETLSLPDNFKGNITCTYVYPGGYVWLGTDNGLFRLDYYNYKEYRADGQRGSIPGNVIYHIGMDYRGDFWASTDGGLVKYNEDTDRFEAVDLDLGGGPEPVITHSGIEGPKGLVIGGDNLLYLYDNDQKLSLLKELACSPPFIVNEMYSGVGNQILLLDKKQGFMVYYPETGETADTHFNVSGSYAYLMDSSKLFWRSEFNKGVECYDRDGNLVHTYTTANSGLSNDLVTCIIERDGRIWLGTDGGGINILNPLTDEIQVLDRDPSNYNTFPLSSVTYMFCDTAGNVWVTGKDGSLVVVRNMFMRTFAISPVSTADGVNSDDVLSILPDEDGLNVWVGTASSGLSRFNLDDETFEYFPATQPHTIVSMAELPQKKILFSSFSQGLFVFDKSTGSVTPLPHTDPVLDNEIRYGNHNVKLMTDDKGIIHILSKTAFSLDPRSGHLSQSDPVHGLDWPDIRNALESSHEFFHTSNRIYRLAETRITRLADMEEGTVINSMFVTRNGSCWLATNRGIGKFDLETSKFDLVETDLFEEALSIAGDNLGRLWIGTSKGLYVYQPDYGTFVVLGKDDGVLPNSYNPDARAVCPDGKVLMGGNNGLLSIDPAVTFTSDQVPTIVLTDVLVDGIKLRHHNGIILKWDYNTLTAKIFVHEENILKKKKFRFHITGPARRDDVIVTDEPQIVTRYNRYGEYVISASCTLKNGQWIDETEVLRYGIERPWFLSWWFFCLLIVCAFAGVNAIIQIAKRSHENRTEQRSQEERLNFLVNVNHELRTPLTLILGRLSRILRKRDRNDPDYGNLRALQLQAERMKYLMDTILTVDKIVEKPTLQVKNVTLNLSLKHACEDFQLEADGYGIELVTNLDPDADIIECEWSKIRVVFDNIMMNAIKHQPPGGSQITVVSQYHADTDTVRVSVIDQGPGIGDENPDKLFTKYYQSTEETAGFGIGLSYAKVMIDLHKGSIGAYNNVDRGATFWFELPRFQSTDFQLDPSGQFAVRKSQIAKKEIDSQATGPDQAAADTKPAGPVIPGLAGKTLLFVDDDPGMRRFVESEMKEYCQNLVLAQNGKEAVRMLGRNWVDVIVSDVMMPAMDGYELCQFVKSDAKFSHIPVVLLTARADEKSRRIGTSVKADHYMSKPFTIESLVKVLDNLLR